MDCLKKEICEITFTFQKQWILGSFPRTPNPSQSCHYETSHSCSRSVQATDAKKLFNGNAALSLAPSGTTLSLTIDGSLIDKKFTVGKANLYKRIWNNEPFFLEIAPIQNYINNNIKWHASNVLDLKHVHSNACFSTLYQFVLEIDLFYSEPKISEVTKSFIDFENSKFADLIVAVKKKEFKVHKVILMERSEVFERMFSHTTTKESLEGIVKIEDFEPEVVENFLIFLYSGIVNEDKFAPDLYMIADKYDVKELQEICLEKMNGDRFLNNENILDVLIVAEEVEKEDLKKKCFDYIKSHESFWQSAFFTSGWATIIHEFPELAEKIKGLFDSKKN